MTVYMRKSVETYATCCRVLIKDRIRTHNILQEHVMSYTDARTLPYEIPSKVPSDVTSVLAWCGSSPAKIVTRFPPHSFRR